MERIVLAWSGGKDSALALWELTRRGGCEIAGVLTTVTEGYDRISMHGVRVALLERQAEALGLPLDRVAVTPGGDHEQYESRMRRTLLRLAEQGVTGVAFGDVRLEDLRRRREGKLAEVGMKGLFPLWHRDGRELATSFIEAGFGALITCVDSEHLDRSFAGRAYDESLLRDLPAGVDPAGENGEFHTFVHAGPVFAGPIPVKRGQIVLREGRFWYCDLLPTEPA